MINEWKIELLKKNQLNQPLFNKLLYNHKNIKSKPLPSLLFPSGKLFFNKFNNTQRSNAVVVHNNYIVGGNNKRDRFKKYNLWNVDVDDPNNTDVVLLSFFLPVADLFDDFFLMGVVGNINTSLLL